MDETKTAAAAPRTGEEINKEYGNVAALVGEKSFTIQVLKSEVQSLQTRMFELRNEFKAASEQKPTEVAAPTGGGAA